MQQPAHQLRSMSSLFLIDVNDLKALQLEYFSKKVLVSFIEVGRDGQMSVKQQQFFLNRNHV